jgi:uncharacterized membrane protein YhaH (DUF805 family)
MFKIGGENKSINPIWNAISICVKIARDYNLSRAIIFCFIFSAAATWRVIEIVVIGIEDQINGSRLAGVF